MIKALCATIYTFAGGPYAAFGGRDASRGLATFSVTKGSDTYDDLSDLSPMEMDSVREWEMQFTGIYLKRYRTNLVTLLLHRY